MRRRAMQALQLLALEPVAKQLPTGSPLDFGNTEVLKMHWYAFWCT